MKTLVVALAFAVALAPLTGFAQQGSRANVNEGGLVGGLVRFVPSGVQNFVGNTYRGGRDLVRTTAGAIQTFLFGSRSGNNSGSNSGAAGKGGKGGTTGTSGSTGGSVGSGGKGGKGGTTGTGGSTGGSVGSGGKGSAGSGGSGGGGGSGGSGGSTGKPTTAPENDEKVPGKKKGGSAAITSVEAWFNGLFGN